MKAKLVAAEGAGHAAGGMVAAETRRALHWVFEGEERWGSAPKQASESL